MLRAFKEHIQDQFPELFDSSLLLACSGGLDSTVLVHLCNELGLYFAIAHCNFGLRGAASDEDAFFVEDLAEKLNKEFFVKCFDTEAYVKKHKVSVQMAARDLRYRWFTQLAKKNDFKYLLTAHHLDDQLETFLINLSRGTGIQGLLGIPSKTDWIARPLLPFSRSQITAYAESRNLDWREDASNWETKYRRNKIRNEIVPLLKELHPTFLDNFKHTLEYLEGSSGILDKHLDEIKARLFSKEDEGYRISCDPLRQLSPLNAYLHALFREYGFTEWNNVENLLDSGSGKELVSKTHRLLKDREDLLLRPIKSKGQLSYEFKRDSEGIDLPVHLQIKEVSTIEETAKHILYVDKETLKPVLNVRKWEKGDYFYPLGMEGKKKVSKFFKDEKMDLFSKEKQWLLCSGDKVVWILGRRADERFKVTDNTKRILKISLLK